MALALYQAGGREAMRLETLLIYITRYCHEAARVGGTDSLTVSLIDLAIARGLSHDGHSVSIDAIKAHFPIGLRVYLLSKALTGG
jgi:hypothetical protein